MSYANFNDAPPQSERTTEYSVIPDGTIAAVRLNIKPGGYNSDAQGWSGDYATKSATTGSIYLNCVYEILSSKHKGRKVFGTIGLHSPKGPRWGQMGRSYIRAILGSANGITADDNSSKAQDFRCIDGLGDLEGLAFVARIDVEKDAKGEQKNAINMAIVPPHHEYQKHKPKFQQLPVENDDESTYYEDAPF